MTSGHDVTSRQTRRFYVCDGWPEASDTRGCDSRLFGMGEYATEMKFDVTASRLTAVVVIT